MQRGKPKNRRKEPRHKQITQAEAATVWLTIIKATAEQSRAANNNNKQLHASQPATPATCSSSSCSTISTPRNKKKLRVMSLIICVRCDASEECVAAGGRRMQFEHATPCGNYGNAVHTN